MFLFLVQILSALSGVLLWWAGERGLGAIFLLIAFFGLSGQLVRYFAKIQAEELELNRKQRLAKFKVGTDAYYAERAMQRADDAAEDARRIRNRNAEYEAQLARQKARKAADEDEEDQLGAGQLF
jgi:hypothetical protein